MSDAATGRKRVSSVVKLLSADGYFCIIQTGSGQKRGARVQALRGFIGDVLALHPDPKWPDLLIEVGGEKKIVRANLDVLRRSIALYKAETARYGRSKRFEPLVVRFVARRQRWHSDYGVIEEAADLLDLEADAE